MNCAICSASAFEHHGYAGWLCGDCAERGAEAYEFALGATTPYPLRIIWRTR